MPSAWEASFTKHFYQEKVKRPSQEVGYRLKGITRSCLKAFEALGTSLQKCVHDGKERRWGSGFFLSQKEYQEEWGRDPGSIIVAQRSELLYTLQAGAQRG